MKTTLITLAALGLLATASQAGIGKGAIPSAEFMARHNCWVQPGPHGQTFLCEPLKVGSGGHTAFPEPPEKVCTETKRS